MSDLNHSEWITENIPNPGKIIKQKSKSTSIKSCEISDHELRNLIRECPPEFLKSNKYPRETIIHFIFSKLDESYLTTANAWRLIQQNIDRDEMKSILKVWFNNLKPESKIEVRNIWIDCGLSSGGMENVINSKKSYSILLRREVLNYFKTKPFDSLEFDRWNKFLQELTIKFPLKSADCSILTTYMLISPNGYFEEWFEELEYRHDEFFSLVWGVDEEEFFSSIHNTGNLFKLDFLSQNGFDFLPRLEPRLRTCLLRMNLSTITNKIIAPTRGEGFSLDSFEVDKNSIEILRGLISSNSPVNVLLIGKGGSGKSEFSRSLCISVGKEAWAYKSFDENDSGNQNRQKSLIYEMILASTLTSAKGEVLILDEAEHHLTSSGGLFSPKDHQHKARINSYLDSAIGATIFIVNGTEEIEESTLRRFNFILNFKAPNESRRLRLWSYHCKSLQIPFDDHATTFKELSQRFEVTSALIAQSLKTLKLLQPDNLDTGKVKSLLISLIESQRSVGNGRALPFDRKNTFLLSALNTDTPLEPLIEGLKQWKETPEYDRSGKRMLFYGISGSGKSQFGIELAKILGCELISKRASSLLDKYVGGSEANVRSAFEEAKKGNTLLLIDEIDTFLGDRNKAQRPHEISLVNEFLTCLQEFEGLFIGTSNSLERMDSASLRRLSYKIEFLPLRTDKIIEIIPKYFPEIDLSNTTHKCMENMPPLVVGDFGSIAEQVVKPSSWEELKEALLREAGHREVKTSRVGFI